MASRNHKRNTSSYGPKNAPPHGRPTRPGMAKRNTYHGHQSSSNAPTLSSCNRKSTVEVVEMGGDAEDDSPSFLQFCATCEKQIVTPNFSMLYCSESCRKRDSITSTHSSDVSPLMAPHPDQPHKDIMPQRSPTIVRPLSNTFSELSLYTTNHSSTWDDQEANVQVLPGFPYHRSSSPDADRQYYKRHSSTTNEDAPSLIHSPCSSFGTAASYSSTRPPKSIDLARPGPPAAASIAPPASGPTSASLKSQASTLTSLRVAEADSGDPSPEDQSHGRGSSQRKDSKAGVGQALGSLRQLFSHDVARSPARRVSREIVGI